MKKCQKKQVRKRARTGRPIEPDSLSSTAKRLAGELGIRVTVRMVEGWRRKGYDLKDIGKLTQSLLNQQRPPKGLQAPAKGVEGSEPKAPLEGLDQAEVEKELAVLQRRLIDATNYEEARTLKTQIAGIRDVLRELREQGRYILREDATKAAATAALASRGQWEKIEDSLPPMLEGLTALQMKEKLRDYARAVSLELASVFDA